MPARAPAWGGEGGLVRCLRGEMVMEGLGG